MPSFLLLGFLVGLRHALEPDHVAAVASLATRGGRLRDHARNGVLWGLGHAATLLLLAGGCVLLGLTVPERVGRVLEAAVGVMLVVLGASVLLRLRRRGVHAHAHVHADGTSHWHAHAHDHGARRDHAHAHPGLATLGVGALHGLAGSSALVLLVGGAARTPGAGLAYVASFGLGAVAGMLLLATTIAVPLAAARRRARLERALTAFAGAGSLGIGLHLVWAMASAGAWRP